MSNRRQGVLDSLILTKASALSTCHILSAQFPHTDQTIGNIDTFGIQHISGRQEEVNAMLPLLSEGFQSGNSSKLATGKEAHSRPQGVQSPNCSPFDMDRH